MIVKLGYCFVSLLVAVIASPLIESGHEIKFIDQNENCQFWAGVGECVKNPNYMLQSCKKSCFAVEPSFYATKADAEEAKYASEKAKPLSRWNSTNIILYIMCHDEDSCRIAQHASTPYPTVTKIALLPHTVFFESAIYREFLFYNFAEWKDKEYVGIVQYKVSSMEFFQKYLFRILDNTNALQHPPVVIPLALIPPNTLLMDQAVNAHGSNFSVIWTMLLSRFNYTQHHIRKYSNTRPFVRNSLLIKPFALKKLMTFMNDAMQFSMLDDEVWSAINQNVRYNAGNSAVAREIFHSKKGYYKYYPFIFERLPVFFCYSERFPIYFFDNDRSLVHSIFQLYF